MGNDDGGRNTLDIQEVTVDNKYKCLHTPLPTEANTQKGDRSRMHYGPAVPPPIWS